MPNTTIHKYEIPLENTFKLMLPKGAKVLDCQTQHGIPVIWAFVEEGVESEEKEFVLLGTGFSMPTDVKAYYIDTFQMHNGLFVGHLFERIKENNK